jgi:hypothetical protein
MMNSITTSCTSNWIASYCDGNNNKMNPSLLQHGVAVDVVNETNLFNSSSYFPATIVVDVSNNVSDDDDNDVLEDDDDDDDGSTILLAPMDVDDYVDIELYGKGHNHSPFSLSPSPSPSSITKSATRPASIIKKRNNNDKRVIRNCNSNSNATVRFDTKWINFSHNKSNITRKRRRVRKIKKINSSKSVLVIDSKLWYTRKEIKDSHKSIIKAAKSYEKRKAALMPLPSLSSSSSPKEEEQQQQEIEDIHVLNWFSPYKRKQRSNKRKQMNDIVKAVKEFENSTHTKVPDLLSQLLQRKSK